MPNAKIPPGPLTAGPAAIAEQRDLVAHLTRQLSSLGFAELMTAIQDPQYHATSGPNFGRFSMATYRRRKGLSRNSAYKMLQDLRDATTRLISTQTNSILCSMTFKPTARPSASC